jgi:hypothetical protein
VGTGDERDLPDYARIEPGFPIVPRHEAEIDDADIYEMWMEAGVLPDAEAKRRLREVFVVAIEEATGKLAGVATVFIAWNPQLRMDLWNGRMFVAKPFRSGLLATRLNLETRIRLNDRYQAGEDRRCHGMFLSVENEGLKRAFPEGAWPTRFTFIGEDPLGAHHRIHYFPGAPAPPPPPAAGT